MNYKEYKTHTPPIFPHQEGDIIGYALFKAGHVNEDLTEIDPVNIDCRLNYESFKDSMTIKKESGEFYVCPIHYSETGNYIGEEFNFFYL